MDRSIRGSPAGAVARQGRAEEGGPSSTRAQERKKRLGAPVLNLRQLTRSGRGTWFEEGETSLANTGSAPNRSRYFSLYTGGPVKALADEKKAYRQAIHPAAQGESRERDRGYVARGHPAGRV